MGAILLAYEREQDLAAIETLLQSRGHHVTRSRSGLEALEAARVEPPHAIVSDVQLPLLDGFALCRRLREDPVTRYLPVFLLSFRVEGPKYEAFAAEVGAQRFFPRGSTIEDLATAIDGLKTGTDTMRIPALVPELLDRQEQDRRRVSELEKQVRELTYTNKLLAAAERSARAKVERAAVERVDVARAEAGRADAAADERTRELEARIAELEGQVEAGQARARDLVERLGEHEARTQALAEADAQARDAAAEETRAGHARVGLLETRLTELQSSRAQAQAQASDALRAFGALPLPTLLHDMETHELRAASDSAAALLRLAPESIAGRPLAEVLPAMVAADGSPPPDEVEHTRPDGTLARYALRRASVSYAGRACWITTLIDVTADRAVADAERRARPRAAAIEAAPAATCVLDADGTLLHANAAFRALLLLEAGRTEGVALGQLLADPAEAAAVVASTRPAQVRWKRADGSAFEAESAGDHRQHDQQGRRRLPAIAAQELAGAIAEVPAVRADRLAGEIALQVLGELLDGGIALAGLLAQGLEQDVLEIPVDQGRAPGLGLTDLADRISRAGDGAAIGAGPGDQRVQDHAQGVDIAGRGDGPAEDLLGTRECRRHRGHQGLRGLGAGRDRAFLQELGDAEVQQLHRAVGLDQDVAGLQVAVHDEPLVRIGHRRAHLAKQRKAMLDRRCVAGAVGIDGFAFHQLHHEVGQALLGRAPIEQAGDAGMFEMGQDLPLGSQPLQDEVDVEPRAHQLDRHELFVLGIGTARAVHLAHAATPDQLEQLVRPDPAAGPARGRFLIGFGGEVIQRRTVEQRLGGSVRPQERLELGMQGGIPAGETGEVRGARLGIQCDGLIEGRLQTLPRFRVHDAAPAPIRARAWGMMLLGDRGPQRTMDGSRVRRCPPGP